MEHLNYELDAELKEFSLDVNAVCLMVEVNPEVTLKLFSMLGWHWC